VGTNEPNGRRESWRLLAATCAMLACLIGCGDGRPKRVPVAGQVLIDGKPLSYGFVNFVPQEGRSSGGRLDTQGRFSLTCFEQDDGAIVGSHQVTVNAGEALGTDKMRWHAPKKYADQGTSGLNQTVSTPVNDLVIQISWSGQKPFVENLAPDLERLPHGHARSGKAQ
jgi:hypothetical protein